MSYSLKKILEIVSDQKTFGDKFLFYDKKEKVCCYNFWCYDVEEKKVKISDINHCEVCYENDNNEEKAADEFIVVENSESNTLISGYDRYKAIKNHYSKNKLITVLKIKKIKKIDFIFFIKNMLFRIFILTPLKILYKCFKLLKK